VESDDDIIVQKSAQHLYGAGQKIWDSRDLWNSYKRHRIDRFAREHASARIQPGHLILDAGCGSEGYGWLPTDRIFFDRFAAQIQGMPTPVVGDLKHLPFESQSFDWVVCIASVLNYASAVESISEIGRVLKAGGSLLLHYESSASLEHLGHAHWKSLAARISTINSGRTDHIRVYNPNFIDRLLSSAGLVKHQEARFHILSGFGLRLGFGQQTAARLAALDAAANFLRRFSDDVILLAEKTA